VILLLSGLIGLLVFLWLLGKDHYNYWFYFDATRVITVIRVSWAPV
jgi:hypothetical protein